MTGYERASPIERKGLNLRKKVVYKKDELSRLFDRGKPALFKNTLQSAELMLEGKIPHPKILPVT